MLIDTHCHINCMVKDKFDIPLTTQDLSTAQHIINEAAENKVTKIINVGTSLVESENCIQLARTFKNCFAAIGIHPNDLTTDWQEDFKKLKKQALCKEENKVVAVGEIGFDKHYPEFNLQRQKDAFKAQVDLALEHNLPIIIHTRDAAQETLYALEEYKKETTFRGVIHCFSENFAFANEIVPYNFVLGIGSTLTYPKNNELRMIFKTIPLEKIILETDAPFLPPQIIRGKQNHPKYILTIAEFLAELREQAFATIAEQTTQNARKLFNIV